MVLAFLERAEMVFGPEYDFTYGAACERGVADEARGDK